MDLDLEADLGIDTVKQAEVFAAIREAYGIERDDSLKLRDYPTLDHVVGFVNERTPQTAMPEPPVSYHELPEPDARVIEMTTDPANRAAYHAQLLSEEEDGTRLVSLFTTAPREYDEPGTVLVQDAVGMHKGQVVREVRTPLRRFRHTLMTLETTPLEPDVLETKFYARGVGVVLAVGLSGEADREVLTAMAGGRTTRG